MRIFKIVLGILLRRLDWSITSFIFFFAGCWSISHSLVGGEDIDRGLNLKFGIIAVILAGLFFWMTIGKEIVKEINKNK